MILTSRKKSVGPELPVQPHVVANQANEANADSEQNPKKCSNHGDCDSGEEFEPRVVIVVVG